MQALRQQGHRVALTQRLAVFRSRYSSGKVLSEEEKAAENIYIKKMEAERLAKMAKHGHPEASSSSSAAHSEAPVSPPSDSSGTYALMGAGALAAAAGIQEGDDWTQNSVPQQYHWTAVGHAQRSGASSWVVLVRAEKHCLVLMSDKEGRETVRLYTRKPKELKKKEATPITRPPPQQAAPSTASFFYKNRAAFVALFIANVSLGGYLLYDILVVKKQARDAAEAQEAANAGSSSPLVAGALASSTPTSTGVESPSSIATAEPPPNPPAASSGPAPPAAATPDPPLSPPSSPPATASATVSSVAEVQSQAGPEQKLRPSEQAGRSQLSVVAAGSGAPGGLNRASAPLSEKERRHVLLWVLKHKRQARPGSDSEKLLVDEDKRVLKEYLNTPGKLMSAPFAKLEPAGMSDREKRKVLQWVLDEKRSVKPSSPEEKAKIDGEKAIIKEYLGHWWKLPKI